MLPRKASLQVVEELVERLGRLKKSVDSVPIDLWSRIDHLDELLLWTNEYSRHLSLVGDLSETLRTSPDYDDHDKVASTLLYLVTRFDRMQRLYRNGSTQRVSFGDWFLVKLAGVNWSAVTSVQDTLRYQPSSGEFTIGVVTVLEHEFQSVVRRLDEVYSCTDDNGFGLAILDRKKPVQDLKDVGNPKRETGLAHGRIGGTDVLVLCTGPAADEFAKDRTRNALQQAAKVFPRQPKEGWLVVGVCAGTQEDWPIGTVLVSRQTIFDIMCTKSQSSSEKSRFGVARIVEPSTWLKARSDHFQLDLLYRRVPHGDEINVKIADPSEAPVHQVKFACTNELINSTADRNRLRQDLREGGQIGMAEEIGIEMEATGVSAFGNSPVCVVKGVCDYANDAKAQGWERFKVLFQLYAAETAADFVVQAIRQQERSNP